MTKATPRIAKTSPPPKLLRERIIYINVIVPFYYIGRALFSFDITTLAGATIKSATLRIYHDSVEGTPFSSYGDVVADHVYYGADVTANASLFNGYIVAPAVPGSITGSTGPMSIDVTAAVQADVNADGRLHTQFRLRHANERATFIETNRAFWCTGENANEPLLEITYTL